jgi:hypothetical protein
MASARRVHCRSFPVMFTVQSDVGGASPVPDRPSNRRLVTTPEATLGSHPSGTRSLCGCRCTPGGSGSTPVQEPADARRRNVEVQKIGNGDFAATFDAEAARAGKPRLQLQLQPNDCVSGPHLYVEHVSLDAHERRQLLRARHKPWIKPSSRGDRVLSAAEPLCSCRKRVCPI